MPDTKAETLYGVELGAAPQGCHVVHALALAEGVEVDTGEPTLIVRLSEGLSVWTALGMIEAVATQLRSEFLTGYEEDDDEGDEE